MKTTKVNSVINTDKRAKTKKPKIKPLFKINDIECNNIDEVLYTIQDNEFMEGEYQTDITFKKDGCKGILNFCFNDLPFCCGISEIGSIYYKGEIPGIEYFLDQLAILFKGKTLMINTIQTGDSSAIANHLQKCVNWTKVKTFKNNSTPNTITIWISRNK